MNTPTETKTRRPRGATRKEGTIPVTIWVPKSWKDLLQEAVTKSDTDRSKFTRDALREKLNRAGILATN